MSPRKLWLLIPVVVMLAGCSTISIDQSTMALHYSGNLNDGEHFKNCVKPGSGQVNASGQNYRYPVNQRKWVNDSNATDSQNASGGADARAVHFTSSDGIDMTVTMRTFFNLNTSCSPVTVNGVHYPGGTIEVFHELIGKPRHAYFNSDGTYPTGWEEVLTDSVGSGVIQAVSQVGHNYNSNIWRDQNKWPQFARQVQAKLQNLVDGTTETDLQFFQGFTVNVNDISPPLALRTLFQQRKEAQLKADTVDQNRRVQVSAANAQAKIAKAQADARLAEIKGYGGVNSYLCHLALNKGISCWPPGSNSPFFLQGSK